MSQEDSLTVLSRLWLSLFFCPVKILSPAVIIRYQGVFCPFLFYSSVYGVLWSLSFAEICGRFKYSVPCFQMLIARGEKICYTER